jgi:hypothetical protein
MGQIMTFYRNLVGTLVGRPRCRPRFENIEMDLEELMCDLDLSD